MKCDHCGNTGWVFMVDDNNNKKSVPCPECNIEIKHCKKCDDYGWLRETRPNPPSRITNLLRVTDAPHSDYDMKEVRCRECNPYF